MLKRFLATLTLVALPVFSFAADSAADLAASVEYYCF